MLGHDACALVNPADASEGNELMRTLAKLFQSPFEFGRLLPSPVMENQGSLCDPRRKRIGGVTDAPRTLRSGASGCWCARTRTCRCVAGVERSCFAGADAGAGGDGRKLCFVLTATTGASISSGGGRDDRGRGCRTYFVEGEIWVRIA